MHQVWLRHKNGGGKKFGNDCEVDVATFLDLSSSVGDAAEVRKSEITDDSTIADQSVVSGASVHNSYVHGQSLILAAGPLYVSDSDLDAVRAWDHPSIHNCQIAQASIFGEAVLEGVSLDAPLRIHAGFWDHPPRHHLISGNGIEVTLSECVDDKFHIGCFCLPYDTWTRPNYRQRIGAHSGWTPTQIETAFQKFTEWYRGLEAEIARLKSTA